MKDWESMRLELLGHSYCDDLCEFGSSFDVQLEPVHVEQSNKTYVTGSGKTGHLAQ